MHTGGSDVARIVSQYTLPLLDAGQISIGTCYVPGRETWSRTMLYSILFCVTVPPVALSVICPPLFLSSVHGGVLRYSAPYGTRAGGTSQHSC